MKLPASRHLRLDAVAWVGSRRAYTSVRAWVSLTRGRTAHPYQNLPKTSPFAARCNRGAGAGRVVNLFTRQWRLDGHADSGAGLVAAWGCELNPCPNLAMVRWSVRCWSAGV
jgi:hypothetical protein